MDTAKLSEHKTSVNSDLDENKQSVKQRRIDTRDLKVNIPYCFLMALCGWFGAGHQGFALNLTNSTQNILPYAMEWPKNETTGEFI